MSAPDPNGSGWFLLRTREDFEGHPGATREQRPELSSGLFYDDGRWILELVPGIPARGNAALSGLAVSPDGESFRVADDGRLLRGCAGEEERPVVREPWRLGRLAGLSVGREGCLYAADLAGGRIVVVRGVDGGIEDVIEDPRFRAPVDVAVDLDGRVFVADASAGAVFVFGARHQAIGVRVYGTTAGDADPPAQARPIAVMVDPSGELLVVDAYHPRLVHFDREGVRLADVEPAALAAELQGGDSAAEAIERMLRVEVPDPIRRHARPTSAKGEPLRLVLHRALRLLRLRLQRRFAAEGTFVSATLDSGIPNVAWHRIELDADIPAGSRVVLETAAQDRDADWDDATWTGLRTRDGETPAPVPQGICDLALMGERSRDGIYATQRGRFLRVRLRLSSDGASTPAVRSIRVLYPRNSYVDLLPALYRGDTDGGAFLERFLSLMEGVFTGIEERYEDFSRDLNPEAAPREVIDWLACLVDLAFDPSWPLEKRRRLVTEAMDLYRHRGTVRGIERYVEIYTGHRPELCESFLSRPDTPVFLGRQGSVLGCPFRLLACQANQLPEHELLRRFAHRFVVHVFVDDDCDAELVLPVVDRIVETNKPAHTEHELRAVFPDARVGEQSSLGIDFVLGDPAPPFQLPLDACEPPTGDARTVLGVDSVLARSRSHLLPLQEPN